jgi:anti-sigma factor RsiW
MADIPKNHPPTHDEMLEQAMAYYGGDLSPEEAAAFEAHLATCPGCQEALRLAKESFPLVEQLLAFKPKHTIDEQVARFEAMVAEKRRRESSAAQAQPRRALWLGLAFGAALAAAATLAFLRIAPRVFGAGDTYGPNPPKSAGPDGG